MFFFLKTAKSHLIFLAVNNDVNIQYGYECQETGSPTVSLKKLSLLSNQTCVRVIIFYKFSIKTNVKYFIPLMTIDNNNNCNIF